jgi:excisionase family DNA binding protein
MAYGVTYRQRNTYYDFLYFICVENQLECNIMDNPFEKIDHRLDSIEKKMFEVVDMLQKKDSLIAKTVTDEKLVKIERAAEITGYKKGYLYELVFKNAIPYIRINRSIRFDPEELERWMRSGRPKVLNDLIRNYG